MRCDQNQSKKLALRIFVRGGVLAVILLLVGMTTGATAFAAGFTNRIMAIQDKGGTGIQIVAEKEINSRYTSYLLSKPPRVVFDFQGTDISALPTVTKLPQHPVREIRLSLYESAAVKSGRVELILTDRVPYKVQVDGNILTVNFTPDVNPPATTEKVENSQSVVDIAPPVTSPVSPPVAAEVGAEPPPEMKPPAVPATVSVPAELKKLPANNVLEIIGRKGEILLRADGELDRCKSFALKNPARYVVDCFGVSEKIAAKVVRLSGPVKLVRIGNYPDKVRFVLEGDVKAIDKVVSSPVIDGLMLRYDGKALAKAHVVSPSVSAIAVVPEEATHDKGKAPAAVAPIKVAISEKVPKDKIAPLTVEKVDFKVEDGKSLVTVALSAPGEVMQPLKDKSLLRFGIKGATITPALRRTIDASAFPSVIRQITPYTVTNRGQSDVRFAVELKGDAPYELKNDGKIVTLLVENGPYTKTNAPLEEKVELPLAAAGAEPQKIVAVPTLKIETTPVKASPEVITNETLKVTADKKYTGQLVSLNFDNIEIRNVLLLIAEVSDTNIIANDDVKGVITLRLNNVPWDQALDVIMESKGLGMEREGNILRVAPKEVILKRKLDKATMESEISEKSPNATKAFSLNYGPVDDIAKKIEDHLKGKGSVSADARTRQIIVTATPDKLNEIEEQIIKRLDVPDQQVTIEARIVEANSNFTRDLGVSWGISQQGTANGPWDLNGAMITGGGSFTINPGTQATNTSGPVFNSSAGIGSQFSFGRIGIDSTILDLRLSALEASGYGKIVSTPRITTSNGEAAEISQGTQIPYQTTSDKGTETKFIAATLALKVKPVINPDNSMILEIEVSNDSVGSTVAVGVGSAPSINTKKAKTKVLVKNGETTVIGGIFIETETESEVGIPLLRSIPILGYLFKSTKKSKDKTELMIFITPRIVE
jgi:type IV pilus assembly protein PilQ